MTPYRSLGDTAAEVETRRKLLAVVPDAKWPEYPSGPLYLPADPESINYVRRS